MRLWRIPMVCLDNRRLNAQHNEVHVALSCMAKVVAGEPPSGWASLENAQIGPWFGRRGALYRYHNDIVVPECRRRFPASQAYATHQMLDINELPEHERNHEFWDYITWDHILLDIRHLIEKHNNDTLIVEHARQQDQKTRVQRPTGHNAIAVVKVFHRAISHVYGIDPNDFEALQRKAIALSCQRLLDRPKLTSVHRIPA